MRLFLLIFLLLTKAFSVIANEHHGAPSHLFFACQSKLSAAKIHPHSVRCSFCGRRHVWGGGEQVMKASSQTRTPYPSFEIPLFHFGTLSPYPRGDPFDISGAL